MMLQKLLSPRTRELPIFNLKIVFGANKSNGKGHSDCVYDHFSHSKIMIWDSWIKKKLSGLFKWWINVWFKCMGPFISNHCAEHTHIRIKLNIWIAWFITKHRHLFSGIKQMFRIFQQILKVTEGRKWRKWYPI